MEYQAKLELARKVKENNVKLRKEKLSELDKAKSDLFAAETAFKSRTDAEIKRREIQNIGLIAVRMAGLRHGDQLAKLKDK